MLIWGNGLLWRMVCVVGNEEVEEPCSLKGILGFRSQGRNSGLSHCGRLGFSALCGPMGHMLGSCDPVTLSEATALLESHLDGGYFRALQLCPASRILRGVGWRLGEAHTKA